MKRWFCLFIILIFTLFSFNISAENIGISVSKDKSVLTVGDTVTFTVAFNTGSTQNAFSYVIEYSPSLLEFVSSSTSNCNDDGNGNLIYVATGNQESITETFTFRCLGVSSGFLSFREITSADFEEHYYPDYDYGFKIQPFGNGDLNGDGLLSVDDLASLKLHLAGISGDIIKENGDLDGSGKIDVSDLAVLKLLLAGL